MPSTENVKKFAIGIAVLAVIALIVWVLYRQVTKWIVIRSWGKQMQDAQPKSSETIGGGAACQGGRSGGGTAKP